MKAKRICAYCKTVIGYKETADGRDTHGICNPCNEIQNIEIIKLRISLGFYDREDILGETADRIISTGDLKRCAQTLEF